MFQVLAAQSSQRFPTGSCIYQGMELRFVYNTSDCLYYMHHKAIDVLVLKAELDEVQEVQVKKLLKTAHDIQLPVICILNDFNIEFMIHHPASFYFIEPVSSSELLKKLHEIKSEKEGLTIQKRVIRLLHALGIPSSVLGYNYLVEAIVCCVYEEKYLKKITRRLYPKIAGEQKTTVYAVEKSIRDAIERAFCHSHNAVLYDFFKGTIRSDKAKATNAQFISMCVEYIKNEGLQ